MHNMRVCMIMYMHMSIYIYIYMHIHMGMNESQTSKGNNHPLLAHFIHFILPSLISRGRLLSCDVTGKPMTLCAEE